MPTSKSKGFSEKITSFDFGQPFVVNSDGDAFSIPWDEYQSLHIPQSVGDEGSYGVAHDGSKDWKALSGYTQQYGYRGPVMHTSEFFGGRMFDDIMSRPGMYVLQYVEDIETGDLVGWCILENTGYES